MNKGMLCVFGMALASTAFSAAGDTLVYRGMPSNPEILVDSNKVFILYSFSQGKAFVGASSSSATIQCKEGDVGYWAPFPSVSYCGNGTTAYTGNLGARFYIDLSQSGAQQMYTALLSGKAIGAKLILKASSLGASWKANRGYQLIGLGMVSE